MITTEQFEHKLIEYLDGELSDAEKREVEEYLQAHPEAIELKGDFSASRAVRSWRQSEARRSSGCSASRGCDLHRSASPPFPQICSWRPIASSLLASTTSLYPTRVPTVDVASTPVDIQQRTAGDRSQPDLAVEPPKTVPSARASRRTRRASDPPRS